jgi:hypothetical protein
VVPRAAGRRRAWRGTAAWAAGRGLGKEGTSFAARPPPSPFSQSPQPPHPFPTSNCRTVLTGEWESPAADYNNPLWCGRAKAFLTAPTAGSYYFYMANDDVGQLNATYVVRIYAHMITDKNITLQQPYARTH